MGRYGNESAKRRDPMITYRHKVERITKWYNDLMACREKEPNRINPNTKQPAKVRELKALSYYIEKIRKPRGE